MIQSVVYRIGLGSLRELRLSIKNLILLVLVSMFSTAVWGLQTIAVGPGLQYATIQGAVDAAMLVTNDVSVEIRIAPGVYELQQPVQILFPGGVNLNSLILKPISNQDIVILNKTEGSEGNDSFIHVVGDSLTPRNITIEGIQFLQTGYQSNYGVGLSVIDTMQSVSVLNCKFYNIGTAVHARSNDNGDGVFKTIINNNYVEGKLYWTALMGNDQDLLDDSIMIANNTVITDGGIPVSITSCSAGRRINTQIINNIFTNTYIQATHIELSQVTGGDNPNTDKTVEFRNNRLLNYGVDTNCASDIIGNLFVSDGQCSNLTNFINLRTSYSTDLTTIEGNTFWGSVVNTIIINPQGLSRPTRIKNNSFIHNTRALRIIGIINTSLSLVQLFPEISNNIFLTTQSPCLLSDSTPSDTIVIKNSWFNVNQSSGCFEMDTDTCLSGGSPFILDNENHTYTLAWTADYISPLIDAGIGEFDPDRTPPDIGAVRAIDHDYWDYTFSNQADQEKWYWVSYPVLNTRTNDVLVASEFFKELLLKYQGNNDSWHPTYLDEIDWMEDGDLNSVDWINSNWSENQDLHYVSSPQGYKIKLLPRTPTLVTLRESGFRTPQDTSFPLYRGENWIGYFPQDPAWPHEAFADIWEDINMIKTKNWCLVRDPNWANYWGLAGKIGRLNPGDMVIVTTNQDHDFHWNTASPAPPQLPSTPEFFTFDEKQDYIPVYLSLPDSLMIDLKEIGLYLDGVCKGAVVVENNVEQICAYLDLDEKLTDGVVEFVFYYNDAKSQDQECRSIRIDSTRLRARYVDDNSRYSYFKVDLSPEDMQNATSPGISLYQNYPNPFNPSTTISYSLPEAGQVKLEIFNLRGQLVQVLTDSREPAGEHLKVWNGTDQSGNAVASGVYFYRLITPSRSICRRMLLMK
ncbi:MAG: hypothetical protein CVU49_09095 [Candidatus Cloacimonetes bacterium HGW-Cloacimonetes-2]|nr:MAG: hypothetical protein CVU49_09095 [Candidatus Cloacimonetes bacterium HGW-Cloacimonetes-2]